MDVSIWMLVGFLLAAYSVVANDSLQTLGTYLSSNRKRTPKPVQMLFICTVTCGVLLLGWFLNNGDPTWGRLSVPGKEFPWPEPFTWVYVIPPLAVVALTQWGAPVSTSFLVLSSFMPANIGTLLSIYGREVTLTNCDQFTRSHLASEGVELAPVEVGPQDQYQEEREVMGPMGQLHPLAGKVGAGELVTVG